MTHVPDNIINPTTVKPMEVSFIGISCIVSTTEPHEFGLRHGEQHAELSQVLDLTRVRP